MLVSQLFHESTHYFAGFNNQVLILNEKNGGSLLRPWPTGGYSQPLSGLYGHTTVYHQAMQAFYVYGGISYSQNRVKVSNSLYVLHYPSRKWSIIPGNEGRVSQPYPRAMHGAVGSRSYMLIYGGLTDHDWVWQGHGADELEDRALSLFVYSCGLWINLEGAKESVSLQAPAMTIDTFTNGDKEDVYLIGKF